MTASFKTWLFPGWMWTLPRAAKRIVLTFDDGPDANTTPSLLDALEKLNIPVTMFLTGWKCRGNEAVVREIVRRGHLAANHGFSHRRFFGRSPGWQRNEIHETHRTISECGVEPCRLFRPPFGSFDWRTLRIAKSNGYAGILWSVIVSDWKPQSAEVLCDRLTSRLHENAIIVLHDAHPTTRAVIDVLPRLAESVGERGWSFARLDIQPSPIVKS